MQKKCRPAKSRRRQALASHKMGRLANRLQGQEAGVLGFLRPYKIGEDLFFGLGLGNAGGLSGLNAF